MSHSAIERISSTTNAAVVQLPERKHPGVVIQGDSLANLCRLAADAQDELTKGNIQEAAELFDEVRELLDGYYFSFTQAIGQAAVRGADD